MRAWRGAAAAESTWAPVAKGLAKTVGAARGATTACLALVATLAWVVAATKELVAKMEAILDVGLAAAATRTTRHEMWREKGRFKVTEGLNWPAQRPAEITSGAHMWSPKASNPQIILNNTSHFKSINNLIKSQKFQAHHETRDNAYQHKILVKLKITRCQSEELGVHRVPTTTKILS